MIRYNYCAAYLFGNFRRIFNFAAYMLRNIYNKKIAANSLAAIFIKYIKAYNI